MSTLETKHKVGQKRTPTTPPLVTEEKYRHFLKEEVGMKPYETNNFLSIVAKEEQSEKPPQREIFYLEEFLRLTSNQEKAELPPFSWSAVIPCLLKPEEVSDLALKILPELHVNSEFREALRLALEQANVSQDHPAYTLLKEAEETACWAAAAQEAVSIACQELESKGVGVVFGRDGAVYASYASGKEELLLPVKALRK